MQWQPAVRRLHRMGTLLIGAQLLIWTITGFAFTWFDFARVRGEADRQPPPTVAMEEVRVSVAEAVARAGRGGHGLPRVVHMELLPLLGHPIYSVTFEQGTPVVIDARDGSVRPRITVEEAARLARAAAKSRPPVESVELVANEKQAPDLAVPIYRVRLADGRGTEVYLDPATGQIRAWRNDQWRRFDRLWSLHVLGYVSRDNPANLPLRIASGLASVVALTGIALLFATLIRRREVRA